MRVLIWATAIAMATTAAAAQTSAPVQLTGHVVEAITEAPIEGARVRITPVGSAITPPGLQPVELVSGKDGSFAAELPSAQYMITVSKPGYAPVPLPFSARFFVLAPGGTVADLRLAMSRGGSISGRVVDDRGQPLTDFNVWALPRAVRDGRVVTERGWESSPTALLTRTTATGTFTFPGIAVGDYVLVARSLSPTIAFERLPDGRLAYGPTFYPSTIDLQAAAVVGISPGGVIDNVEIAVQPAPTLAVSGIVLDARGAPVPRARIMVGWNPENPGAGTCPSLTVFTEVDGTFRFDVPADLYLLDAVLPSFTPPPGGTDVLMTNPDGKAIYILQNSPRATIDVDVRGPIASLKIVLK